MNEWIRKSYTLKPRIYAKIRHQNKKKLSKRCVLLIMYLYHSHINYGTQLKKAKKLLLV